MRRNSVKPSRRLSIAAEAGQGSGRLGEDYLRKVFGFLRPNDARKQLANPLVILVIEPFKRISCVFHGRAPCRR